MKGVNLGEPYLLHQVVTEEICGWETSGNSTEAMEAASVVSSAASEAGVPIIAWPFIISGAWCMLFSFGFLLLAKLPFKVS